MGFHEQQVAFNAESRGAWQLFERHRGIVTRLLLEALPVAGGRLCVLGAGNCNDLDLAALLRKGREIHLVDLDADALSEGVARQDLHEHPTVYRHGGIDLTGAPERVASWSPQTSVTDAELAECAEAPVRRIAPNLPGPIDVVASTCLLSQLLGTVVGSLGAGHSRFVSALQAIRAGHLRLLLDLIAPGGAGVLVSDFVSSDSYPPLAGLSPDALGGILPELIRTQNFFHGANPAVINSLLRSDPAIAPQIAELEPVRPWLWNLGPRVYAVAAWRFRKRGGVAPA
jgi:hypothetical protein